MADMTLVEDLTIDNSNEALSIDEAVPHLEKELQSSLGSDGFLSDVVTTSVAELAFPEAIDPWIKRFDIQLYHSPAATKALRSLLRCKAPGTSSSFDKILSSVSHGSRGTNHCYLIGGQVRDVLRGQLSTDIDFNYSCSAQDVALITVAEGWPTKFKCIGDGVNMPNCENRLRLAHGPLGHCPLPRLTWALGHITVSLHGVGIALRLGHSLHLNST